MKPATKQFLLGSGAGAAALGIGYSLWQHYFRHGGHLGHYQLADRPPEHENQRGEYGHGHHGHGHHGGHGHDE
jgi:hypothetical protein